MKHRFQHYEEALSLLTTSGIHFCVIGTYGLLLHGVDLSNYDIRDCDLMCTKDQLDNLATAMREAGWDLSVWDEPLVVPITNAHIEGKF